MHQTPLIAAAMAAFLSTGTACAQPAQERDCHVRVLQTLTDDMGNTWQKGRVLPANILRKDDKGTSFWAHGGSCVPRTVNGAQASRLIDCRVGESIGNGDFRLVQRVPSK